MCTQLRVLFLSLVNNFRFGFFLSDSNKRWSIRSFCHRSTCGILILECKPYTCDGVSWTSSLAAITEIVYALWSVRLATERRTRRADKHIVDQRCGTGSACVLRCRGLQCVFNCPYLPLAQDKHEHVVTLLFGVQRLATAVGTIIISLKNRYSARRNLLEFKGDRANDVKLIISCIKWTHYQCCVCVQYDVSCNRRRQLPTWGSIFSWRQ